MAESKRIFNAGKMNRDLDDRLVQPGEYRDALNINIGRSEGSDVGAVENLKGNELLPGQDNIEGTTIGSIRDQANNRIYWFTKGTTVDAIHEYDMNTGMVNPILIDQVSNPPLKPTCTPEFGTPISRPVDDGNTRPPLPPLPDPPAGGCTDPTANNYNSAAVFDNGSCTYDPPPPATDLGVAISGQGAFLNSDSPVTLTATPENALGAISYLWSTGETTQTLEVSGADTTVTGSVTITDAGRISPDNTATANYSVTFSAAVLDTYEFTWTPTGSITNATIAGGVSMLEGTDTVPQTIGETISITPNAGYQWLTLPTITPTSPALPSGVMETITAPTVGNTTGGSVVLSGMWTPDANYTGVVAISGGSVELAPTTHTLTANAPATNGLNNAAGGSNLTTAVVQISPFVFDNDNDNTPGLAKTSTSTINSAPGREVRVTVGLTQATGFGDTTDPGWTASATITGNPGALSGTPSMSISSAGIVQWTWTDTFTVTESTNTTVDITVTD